MKRQDIMKIGSEEFFQALSITSRVKVIVAWKAMMGAEDRSSEWEAMCEIFCNAAQLMGTGPIELSLQDGRGMLI